MAARGPCWALAWLLLCCRLPAAGTCGAGLPGVPPGRARGAERPCSPRCFGASRRRPLRPYRGAVRSPGAHGSSFVYSARAGSVAVMSVDVGSESMKIAIVKPGVPMEIVLNK